MKLEQVARRNSFDVCKQRIRIRRPEEGEKLMHCFRIDFSFYQTRREDCFDFRAKDERRRRARFSWNERVIERLDAYMIADQCQRALMIVPNDESKHAVEAIDRFPAPFGNSGE